LQENKREERKRMADDDAMRKIKQLEDQIGGLQKQVASHKQVDASWKLNRTNQHQRQAVSCRKLRRCFTPDKLLHRLLPTLTAFLFLSTFILRLLSFATCIMVYQAVCIGYIFNILIIFTLQEEEALLNEMEVTGQAYEDMQEQNSRLIQQLREKDDANFKLMSERIKSNQLHKLAREEKQVLNDQVIDCFNGCNLLCYPTKLFRLLL